MFNSLLIILCYIIYISYCFTTFHFCSFFCTLPSKEQVRISLEKRLQQSVSQLEGEKTEEINHLQQRIEELQLHIENLCKQHEEALLRAENDKQQALLIGTYM